MEFRIEKERLLASDDSGRHVGHISFPGIRPGLVNITEVYVSPGFRGQNAEEAMLEALLTYLTGQNVKTALTSPVAQRYVSERPQWRSVLPGDIHFESH